ncbi:MAG: DJ-1/PfpI family protein [Bacteroidales bacterium]|nr:DJ-1/PfpI family protein [Bacteroidales bacterium]
MKGVHIFLADGFEDMEALGTRDVLLRGGVDVRTVSITNEYMVESSHGLPVSVDTNWDDLEVMEPGTGAEDVMIFPGGMPGSKNLAQHAELMEILQDHYARGGAVAAICAAPGLVVSQLPGLEGKHFTCFDGFQDPLIAKGAIFTPESTVTDGQIITGRGAGHAVNFGLAILRYLKGDQAAEKVKAGLML